MIAYNATVYHRIVKQSENLGGSYPELCTTFNKNLLFKK